jgi:hypothetical protein
MGAKNAFFEPFIYANDRFAKTGSGQTRKETLEGEAVFCRDTCQEAPGADVWRYSRGGARQVAALNCCVKQTNSLTSVSHDSLCVSCVSHVCGFVWSVDIPRDGNALL